MVPYTATNGTDTGRGAFVLPLSDHRNALILAVHVAQFVEVPQGARYVVFTATDDFWMETFGDGDTREMSTVLASITDGSAPDFNPAVRSLPDRIEALGVLSDVEGAIVLVSFYGG